MDVVSEKQVEIGYYHGSMSAGWNKNLIVSDTVRGNIVSQLKSSL